jgi:hypothetical protein
VGYGRKLGGSLDQHPNGDVSAKWHPGERSVTRWHYGTGMTVFLACVSGAAFIVSVFAVGYARKAVGAAERSAVSAELTERRERTPRLAILLDNPVLAPGDRVIYRVRNDGPQDLDTLTIYRPRPSDRITYPIGKLSETWADDRIEWASLALTEEVSFTLCCGAAIEVPEFRVRVECRSGTDEWTLNELLPSPRAKRPPMGVARIR